MLLSKGDKQLILRKIGQNIGWLISPQPDLLPDVFHLMVRIILLMLDLFYIHKNRGADKSIARPGSKQATATEDSDYQISYL
jgi:hypothetical protein